MQLFAGRVNGLKYLWWRHTSKFYLMIVLEKSCKAMVCWNHEILRLNFECSSIFFFTYISHTNSFISHSLTVAWLMYGNFSPITINTPDSNLDWSIKKEYFTCREQGFFLTSFGLYSRTGHFKKLGTPLRCIEKYPEMVDQTSRYHSLVRQYQHIFHFSHLREKVYKL